MFIPILGIDGNASQKRGGPTPLDLEVNFPPLLSDKLDEGEPEKRGNGGVAVDNVQIQFILDALSCQYQQNLSTFKLRQAAVCPYH